DPFKSTLFRQEGTAPRLPLSSNDARREGDRGAPSQVLGRTEAVICSKVVEVAVGKLPAPVLAILPPEDLARLEKVQEVSLLKPLLEEIAVRLAVERLVKTGFQLPPGIVPKNLTELKLACLANFVGNNPIPKIISTVMGVWADIPPEKKASPKSALVELFRDSRLLCTLREAMQGVMEDAAEELWAQILLPVVELEGVLSNPQSRLGDRAAATASMLKEMKSVTAILDENVQRMVDLLEEKDVAVRTIQTHLVEIRGKPVSLQTLKENLAKTHSERRHAIKVKLHELALVMAVLSDAAEHVHEGAMMDGSFFKLVKSELLAIKLSGVPVMEDIWGGNFIPEKLADILGPGQESLAMLVDKVTKLWVQGPMRAVAMQMMERVMSTVASMKAPLCSA
ncbi:hypothetical protein CYMTET_17726, partial [Cymbomonas tetramitiformis]